MEYEFTATLYDKSIVKGTYTGNGNTQVIDVPGASTINPVIKLTIKCINCNKK